MIFNLYKPRAISSNKYLQWFRQRYQFKKAGFLGTLDPLAEGVLPVFCDSSTKLIDYYNDSQKSYRFTFQLGYNSASIDSETQIEKIANAKSLSERELIAAFEHFSDYQQVPPIYSAIEINGQTAYNAARKGIQSLTINARPAKILSWQILKIENLSVEVQISCSKGFYIRSLVRDIADLYNQKAILTKLIRTSSGVGFNIESSIGLSYLLTKNKLESCDGLFFKDILPESPTLMIDSEKLKENICNGQKISIVLSDEVLEKVLEKNIEKYFLTDRLNNLIASVKIMGFGTNNNEVYLQPLKCFIN